MIQAASVQEVQEFVRQQPQVRARGGGTKPALSRHANLNLQKLSGIVEYDPGEYTITALAGTPLRALRDQLAEHQQFLAFDPPLADAGATLGGTIASGLSGPGRFRYGGLRDFLLGVRLVSGTGDIVRGGGKVVKNAAGFDIPKLTVGSLGRFGVLVEATFKVFPRPAAYTTLHIEYADLAAALTDLAGLATAPLDASCLELLPPRTLLVRLGGLADALPQRTARCLQRIAGDARQFTADEDQQTWLSASEFGWASPESCLYKIPTTPRHIAEWEAALPPLDVAPRRYSAGGQVLWLSWPAASAASELQTLLRDRKQPAVMIRGPDSSHCETFSDNAFAARLIAVFDPHHKFNNDATRNSG